MIQDSMPDWAIYCLVSCGRGRSDTHGAYNPSPVQSAGGTTLHVGKEMCERCDKGQDASDGAEYSETSRGGMEESMVRHGHRPGWVLARTARGNGFLRSEREEGGAGEHAASRPMMDDCCSLRHADRLSFPWRYAGPQVVNAPRVRCS